jgi:hypothetical protein
MFITKLGSKVGQHILVVLIFAVYITLSSIHYVSLKNKEKATRHSNLKFSSPFFR